MKSEKALIGLILFMVALAIYHGDWQYIPAMLCGALYIAIYIHERT